MPTLRTVLFPSDGSPCAERAFAHAAALAAPDRAEIRVLHLSPAVGSDPEPLPAHAVPAGCRLTVVDEAVPSIPEAILAHAREADLVVMGTHGRHGLRRALLGSTTEEVLHHVDCPLLAVGPATEATAHRPVGRLLVAVDFSASSAVALALADALAARYGACVDAVHAAYVPDLPDVYELGIQFPAVYPDLIGRSQEALAALLAQHVAADRRGEAVVRAGSPVPVLLDTADELGDGLLVLPTHGRTGLARLALGSVAESVIRRAPCAVLAIPSFGRVPLIDPALRPAAHHATAPAVG